MCVLCTHNGFVVINTARTDAYDHPDLAFPFKVVLEEMGELRVSVRDNLNRQNENTMPTGHIPKHETETHTIQK